MLSIDAFSDSSVMNVFFVEVLMSMTVPHVDM